MKRGNWTDEECYYISIKDGKRRALVVGPFKTHDEALGLVCKAMVAGREVDPASHFYAWGTAKRANGHHEGIMNKILGV